jgi:hypothetical protein
MSSEKAAAIVEMLAIGSAPFLALGILAVTARIWNPNLRPTLPWLRGLRWTGWLVGALVIFATLSGLLRNHRTLFSVGAGLLLASISLAVVEIWVKRRYASELLPPASPHGYWPSPRN